MIEFDGDDSLKRGPKGEWGNYFKGVTHFYLPEMPNGYLGYDVVYVSNVTIGGGISSSAAVEVGLMKVLDMQISMCLFIEQCLGIQMDPKDRAMRGYHAEHEYVQMPCGVMDQLISSCGQYGKISLIDCISHDITHFDINPASTSTDTHREWPVTILKLFVHVEHKLVNSQYTERVKECLEGERLLKEKYNVNGEEPVKALCRGPTLEMLANMKEEMPKNVYDRCYHVRNEKESDGQMIRETQRTLSYVDLILAGNWKEIGRLFFESYDDSRDFFQNGHPDITTCIEVLRELEEDGVYGARMLGGGWGGSILCLIEKGKETSLIPRIQEMCDKRLKRQNSCDILIVTESGSGARIH